ncbi:hypothetical protein GF371_04005 [Candidatus Woesearchaeota archaeon]|nr:hypothetical protein [Candidatus Woesearchaeota archaeon]
MVNLVTGGILVMLGSTIAFIIINALILWGISHWLKFKDQGMKTAFLVAVIAGIIAFVLGLIPTFMGAIAAAVALNLIFMIVNVVILLLLIRYFYKESWGRSAIAWILLIVADIIIGAIIGLILGLIIGAAAPGITTALI